MRLLFSFDEARDEATRQNCGAESYRQVRSESKRQNRDAKSVSSLFLTAVPRYHQDSDYRA